MISMTESDGITALSQYEFKLLGILHIIPKMSDKNGCTDAYK